MPLSENPTKSTIIATRRFSAGFILLHGFYRKLAKCHMGNNGKKQKIHLFSVCVLYKNDSCLITSTQDTLCAGDAAAPHAEAWRWNVPQLCIAGIALKLSTTFHQSLNESLSHELILMGILCSMYFGGSDQIAAMLCHVDTQELDADSLT